MKYDTIIHNGIIVTVNRNFDIIIDGVICIKNGKIETVSPGPADRVAYQSENIIDARGGIIMPGLVNTHTHLPMTLLRGIADDLPLFEWLNDYIFPLEAKYMNSGNVRIASLLGCAEMLLSGTTTCCDGYFHEDSVAQAALETGIRGVFGQGVIDFTAPGVPDPADNIKTAGRYAEKWLNVSPLIRPSVFCHSPYTCTEATLIKAKRITRSNNILFQIHTAETKNEYDMIMSKHGVSPVRYLQKTGILDEMTILVHSVWTDEDDIRIISEHGSKISHNPQSNMKLASGIAPVPEFLKNRITVGLGTDGCASNNDPDLFKEMDVAAKIHKVNLLDPTVMDAGTVIQMATIRGAEAIGLGDQTGSIEKGKDADIIIIDTGSPHLIPIYNPVSHIVYSASGSDVRDVLVAGKLVVSDRKLLSFDLNTTLDRINLLAAQIQKDFLTT
ncbi:MAG: amidohydrolase [Desulfobacteraceae bacterium]|nr:MAG: amidohydrolase [Desulfobacteraceae bacterium]